MPVLPGLAQREGKSGMTTNDYESLQRHNRARAALREIHKKETMTDPTENIRRAMVETGQPAQDLTDAHTVGEPTWDTEALRAEFEVLGFMAPFVFARRKSTGEKGSLEFTHSPRVYFDWQPERN
jgi:hypothetical protein